MTSEWDAYHAEHELQREVLRGRMVLRPVDSPDERPFDEQVHGGVIETWRCWYRVASITLDEAYIKYGAHCDWLNGLPCHRGYQRVPFHSFYRYFRRGFRVVMQHGEILTSIYQHNNKWHLFAGVEKYLCAEAKLQQGADAEPWPKALPWPRVSR